MPGCVCSALFDGIMVQAVGFPCISCSGSCQTFLQIFALRYGLQHSLNIASDFNSDVLFFRIYNACSCFNIFLILCKFCGVNLIDSGRTGRTVKYQKFHIYREEALCMLCLDKQGNLHFINDFSYLMRIAPASVLNANKNAAPLRRNSFNKQAETAAGMENSLQGSKLI